MKWFDGDDGKWGGVSGGGLGSGWEWVWLYMNRGRW